MCLVLLLSVAGAQLYRIEYIYGSTDCSGDVFSVLSQFVAPPSTVCQARGCQAGPSPGRSSYVVCDSTPAVPTDKMRCGLDHYSGSDCSGNVLLRQRAAVGVCVQTGDGGSRIYTDCGEDGKPSTFTSYFGTNCQSVTQNPPAKSGRVCTGGTCSAGQKVFCNAVGNSPPPPSNCVTSADINGDGKVDLFDVLEVLGVWGACGTNLACNKADLNCDGNVNLLDMSLLINAWTG